MFKLKETPYIVNHTGKGRKLCVEIQNGSQKIIDSEELAWSKNSAYTHYDASFFAIHAIVNNLFKPYVIKDKTKNNDTMWYSIILHKSTKFTCFIKSYSSETELKEGIIDIANEYHVFPYSIEYRKLGNIESNEEIEEFIKSPILMHEHAMSYKTIRLDLLGEDGKYYG